jgi:C-terminal processing protease CtpA/Prc
MLKFIAYCAPAVLPLAAIIVAIELIVDWNWHVAVAAPGLLVIAAKVFYRTESSDIFMRALALMNVGMAADLCLGLILPNELPWYAGLPMTILAPLIWCLVMWFQQEVHLSFQGVGHATRGALLKTLGTAMLCIPPVVLSYPVYIRIANNVSVRQIDTIQVIQRLRTALPFYRVDERKFLQHMIKTRYLWHDIQRMQRVSRTSPFESILSVALHPLDRWSFIESMAEYQAEWMGSRRGIGVSRRRLIADGHVILSVEPQSPAAQAGLRRGDKIVAINGTVIPRLDWAAFYATEDAPFITVKVIRNNFQVDEMEIPRADLTLQRVGVPKVFDIRGRKVGYLEYDAFSESTRASLIAAMSTLKKQNVSELILDLRYNGGGSTVEEGILAGMLAPSDAINKLASRIFGRRSTPWLYNDIMVAPDQVRPIASPQRLVVITSEATCSASEALITALRPYMPVVLIGSKTCGKPFGMTREEFNSRVYSLITFQIENSLGEGGYSGGLKPTCTAPDDEHFDLGDAREASLAEALFYIENGRCSPGQAA